MPVSLMIKDDLNRLDRVLLSHERALKAKAVPQAINRTVKAVKSHAVKEISRKTSIKQKDVRARLREIKAKTGTMTGGVDARRGTAGNLIDFVSASQKNAYTFRKRTRKGFKHPGVKAKAWGTPKYYEGTFIGRSGKGKLQVYRRTSAGRTKITSVAGPSIRHTFISDQVVASMTSVGRVRFAKELSYAINNQIRRQK